MSYDLEPGEIPPVNTARNGHNAVKRGYSPDGDILMELAAKQLDRTFNDQDAAFGVYKGQIEILRTECESQSRKIQELNAEISRTKSSSAEELVSLRRKYEDEISKLKSDLSELKSTHRETVSDLKDDIRKLEFEKNHSSTWMDRIMDNAPEVIPMIQKLFEQPPNSAVQLANAQEPITQNAAENPTEPQNPVNDEPKTKEALATVILQTAQAYSAGQLDPSVDYAPAIDGMVKFGKAKGWTFSAEDYVNLAEQMVDFAVQQQIEPHNVAKAIHPFFQEIKAVKAAAKLMSVDQITEMLLSQANIDKENYPESHLTMLKAVLKQLKTLL